MHLTAVWFALVAMLVALGGVAPAAAQPAGTLVVGLVAEPVNLDPAQVTDLNSNRVGRRIVETLVMFPDESTQIVPGLAESWTVSKDGLRYTFKLRKGVSFHDGTPFNAEAVKDSIERQINPEHPFNKLGKYPFANYFFGNVKAVEVVDPLTVEFILKEPRASFLAVLTAGAAVDREPHRGEEVRPGLRAAAGGHRPLQVRVVGPRPARGAGEEPELLAVPGEDRPRRLPADRRGPGAADRAAHRQRSTSSSARRPTTWRSSRAIPR